MTYATEYLRTAACDIAACILANERAKVDSVTRILLDGNSNRLRRHLAFIRREMAVPEHMQRMGAFGPNGSGPGIENLIRNSEWHREHARNVTTQIRKLDHSLFVDGEVG